MMMGDIGSCDIQDHIMSVKEAKSERGDATKASFYR
jgi:hypothetical protein